MNKEVALIILFNHRFDKNIEILEKIYKDRFSHIFHIIPFYDGLKENVIAVYENSYNFEGYIAQAFRQIVQADFEHYFFVADDMVINPIINEHNYKEHLKLKESTCFLPYFNELHKIPQDQFWSRVVEAYRYQVKCDGVESANEIPGYEDALAQLNRFGLEIQPLKYDQIFPSMKFPKKFYRVKKLFNYLKWLKKSRMKTDYHLPYPLVGGYADIFVISADAIRKFAHYCGVFAATDLFVEIAIPTAIALSASEIVTEKDLLLKGKALWSDDELKELEPFENQLKNYIHHFPKDYLYLHPVKLSKLNIEL